MSQNDTIQIIILALLASATSVTPKSSVSVSFEKISIRETFLLVSSPHLLDPSSVTIPRPSALFCLSNAFKSRTLEDIKYETSLMTHLISKICISVTFKVILCEVSKCIMNS